MLRHIFAKDLLRLFFAQFKTSVSFFLLPKLFFISLSSLGLPIRSQILQLWSSVKRPKNAQYYIENISFNSTNFEWIIQQILSKISFFSPAVIFSVPPHSQEDKSPIILCPPSTAKDVPRRRRFYFSVHELDFCPLPPISRINFLAGSNRAMQSKMGYVFLETRGCINRVLFYISSVLPM